MGDNAQRWLQQHAERNKNIGAILPAFCESLWQKLAAAPNLKPVDIQGLCIFISRLTGATPEEITTKILHEISLSKYSDSAGRSQTPDPQAKDRLIKYLQTVPLNIDDMLTITNGENLACKNIFPAMIDVPVYTDEQLENLQSLINAPQMNFTGSVSVLRLETGTAVITSLASDAKHADKYYCIASVGKVFTGILALKMVHDGVFKETKLTEIGVHIPDEILNLFPDDCRASVKQRLSEVSLHQLMTHKSGFGDCYGDPTGGGYFGYIATLVKSGQQIPAISDTNELFKYADNKVNELTEGDKFRYSNLGIMLLAAELQYLYNQHHQSNYTYQQILEIELLIPAKIKLFQARPAVNSCYAENDIYGANLFGGPAGGYWATSNDLVIFGNFVRNDLYKPSQIMQDLFANYGQEFFDAPSQEITHRGDIPNGSTMFNVSLRSGTCWVALSDRGGGAAANLHMICRERLEQDRLDLAAAASKAAAKKK